MMRLAIGPSWRWAASLVTLALLGGAAACSSILGIESGVLDVDGGAAEGGADATMETGDDGGDRDASDAASDVPRSGDATDEEASTGPIVYVSGGGSDTNSGLDPMHPKRTIEAGLILATTLPGLPTVEVCAGPSGTPYSESLLTVGQDVQLLGGWDCTFQKRNPPAYPTLVTNADASSQHATLLVSLSATVTSISSKTVIDGFIINGGSAAAVSMGVEITGSNVSPVLSNDVISGGGGTGGSSDTWASIGVHVASGGTPEIKNCVIRGGSGSGANNGSAGIAVESADPNIHQDVVFGGSGAGANGSAGMSLAGSMTMTQPVANVLVYGNDAEDPSDAGAAARGSSSGIMLNGRISATIESSVILGGKSSPAYGVFVDNPPGATNVTLAGDRIYGGVGTGSVGVYIAQVSQALTIVNSEIHAGSDPSVAVLIDNTQDTTIADTTIYAGAGTGIIMNINSWGASFHNDLFVGSGAASSVAMSVARFAQSINSLDHTGFANFGTYYVSGETSASDLASLLVLCTSQGMTCTGDLQIGGPVVMGSGCPGAGPEAGCVSDPSCPGSAPTCLGSIFGSWVNDGTDIFSPPPDGGVFADWAVLSQFTQVICGGIGQSDAGTDLLGHPRSTMDATSMGAVVTASPACPQ